MENQLDIKKILLVVPITHTHYVTPPIGLGYLAAALRQNKFSNIYILDCLKEGVSYDKLRQYFKELKAYLVGFQVFSSNLDSVIKSIDILKQECPGTIVIVGGPHISATKTEALEEIKLADFGFMGEAEDSLPLLAKRLINFERIALEDIPGLIWREDGVVRMNPGIFINNLDRLAFPSWDLMPPEDYPDNPQGVFYKNFPIAPIITTRGCPYACTFCGSGVNMGKKLRLRSIKNVLDEMDILYRDFGVREFHIIDDMFNFYKERVLEFCQGIKQRNWKISYTFPNGIRLNHLDREMLQEMKETGLYAFTVGVESGSQRMLYAMKKNLSLELIEDKINLINSIGIEPSGFFIIGYPGERVEDIQATIKFAKKLKLKRAHFSNFLPLPGTEATNRLLENKEIDKLSYASLAYSKVPYSPRGITKIQLKGLQRRAFLEFYLRPRTLLKLFAEIKSYNHFKMFLKRIFDYLL